MSEEVPALPKLEPSEPLFPKDPSAQDDTKPRRPFPTHPIDAADIIPSKHTKSTSFAPPTPSASTKPKRTATVGSQDKPTLIKLPSFQNGAVISEEKTELPVLTVIPDYPTPNTIVPPRKGPESAIPGSSQEQSNNQMVAKVEGETNLDKPLHEPQPPPELRPQTGTAKSRVMSFLRTGSFAILKKPDSTDQQSNSTTLEEKKKNRMSFFNPRKERTIISGPVTTTLPVSPLLSTPSNIPATSSIPETTTSTQNIALSGVTSTQTIPSNNSAPRQSVLPIRAGSIFISSDQQKRNLEAIERLESQVRILTTLVSLLISEGGKDGVCEEGLKELAKTFANVAENPEGNGVTTIVATTMGDQVGS